MAANRVTANDWLPCAAEGRAEAARHIPVIVKGILDGAASGDWHRLMRKSVHGLKRYLDNKYLVPIADRAALATVMYRVVTEEPMLDQHLQKLFTQQLVRLLKHEPDQGKLPITLPWKPLFRIIDMLFFGKARIPQTPLCPYLGYNFVSLARLARHYFAPDAGSEIMLEMRPFLCAHHTGSLFKGQVLLTLLLPRGPSSDLHIVREIMALWRWVVAYADWDLHWIVFLASLCRHTYRDPVRAAQWEEFVPELLTHVLHIIDLPVGPSKMHIYGNMENSVASPEGSPFFSLASFVHLTGSRSKTLQLIHKAAKLIVYLLRPSGGGAFALLRRVIKAVESYLHPSNGGYWTYRLAQLLASLCEYITERVRAEKQLPEGQAGKLTTEDITCLAELILPLALQGLYSKSGTATLQSCLALKGLGFLAPRVTLPPLLVRIYQALTTLTEVHQTSSALEALAAVIYPVIRSGCFEAGVSHVPDLMELTLTGIDANDLPKTWATLRFYTVLLSGVPLLCLPDACPEGCDPQRHEVARMAVDSFADWAFRFLDQTFTFIANHNASAPAQGVDQPNKADADTRTSEYFFHCTLEVFFMQLGDELYAAALNKVHSPCCTRPKP
jgi:proteasome activator subunit 4